jgi:GPI inositol-deacylase
MRNAIPTIATVVVLVISVLFVYQSIVLHAYEAIELHSCDDYRHAEQYVHECTESASVGGSVASALIQQPYRFQEVFRKRFYSLHRFHAPIPRLHRSSVEMLQEQSNGNTTALHGRPVLFIPGHGGSFRQSIPLAISLTLASWDNSSACQVLQQLRATNDGNVLELDEYQRLADMWHSQVASAPAALDLFAIDFNGDLTLFHGSLVQEQASFVADALMFLSSLYQQQQQQQAQPMAATTHSKHRRTSIQSSIRSTTIVAHSMGGMVARIALMQLVLSAEKVRGHSSDHDTAVSWNPLTMVNSLILLGTPVVSAPLTSDIGIGELYASVNDFWMTHSSGPLLEHLFTVSISGGYADNLVLTELTDVNWFRSPEHHVCVAHTGDWRCVFRLLAHRAH